MKTFIFVDWNIKNITNHAKRPHRTLLQRTMPHTSTQSHRSIKTSRSTHRPTTPPWKQPRNTPSHGRKTQLVGRKRNPHPKTRLNLPNQTPRTTRRHQKHHTTLHPHMATSRPKRPNRLELSPRPTQPKRTNLPRRTQPHSRCRKHATRNKTTQTR